MPRSVMVLELNELCPPLLDRFMASGHLPNIARLRGESACFITEAGEPQEHLNPWIQWVTAHTGARYETHGVFKLGEGSMLTLPTLADAVGNAGGQVWMCGPMNVVPTEPVRGWWLPDPWNPGDAPVPADLEPFATFVRANVQEHSNASARLSRTAYLRFLAFMARHGLSFATVAATVRQLVGERTGRCARWRRAALLDRFQWDLFRHHWTEARPAFATYFSNTTAHYQHVYWRHMDPEPFTLKPDAEAVVRYGDAVPFGYREMDRLVGDALAMVDDDTTLVLCTALSQQPYLLKEHEGGNRFHRPHDMVDLLTRLGVVGLTSVSPVMAAQFHAYFAVEDAARSAADLLRGTTVDGRAAFDVRLVGTDVFTGCAITTDVAPEAVLTTPAGIRLPFHDHLYRAETAKSGYHHPDGALWIRSPRLAPTAIDERVPLQSVAPTLLALLGVPAPPTMTAPAIGSVAESVGW